MLLPFRVSMASNVPMVVPTDASVEIREWRFATRTPSERVDAELPERDQRGLLDGRTHRLDAHVRAAEHEEVPLMYRVVGDARTDGRHLVPERTGGIDGRTQKLTDEPESRCDRPEVNADSRHVRSGWCM